MKTENETSLPFNPKDMSASNQIDPEESPANFREQRLNQLFDECRNTILEQIMMPFGLSMIMFEDQDGGNINTIHNVRNGVFATVEEKEKFMKREPYDPHPYHDGNAKYRNFKKGSKEAQASGQLTDKYTGNPIDPGVQYHVDHVIPSEFIHNDAGVILAESNQTDLANNTANLAVTNPSINCSKNNKTMEQFVADWEKNRPERLQKIKELQSKGDNLTEAERKELSSLENIEEFSPEKAKKVAEEAKKQYEKTINKDYYTSKKFLKSAAKDIGMTAVKTALQQAIGKLLVEFVRACFHEIKMLIKERDKIKNVFEDLKVRMKRILNKMIEKLKNWKDIAADLRDGLLAGAFASLTTTLINIFATTAKRFVRAIREGFRSLVQTFKLLFFRPADMTAEDAMKAIIKSLSSVFITTVGIAAEAALNTFIQGIPVLGQFASIITPVLIGIMSGISIALVSYLVDIGFDIFNKSERDFNNFLKIADTQMEVAEKWDQMLTVYVSNAETFSAMVERGDVIISTNDQILVWMNSMMQRYGTMEKNSELIVYLLDRSREIRQEILDSETRTAG